MPSSEKQVNSLLHLLRGEDFRRLQNQRHSRSHLTSRVITTPTLPRLDYYFPNDDTPPHNGPRTGRRGISGPPPPPSWVNQSSRPAVSNHPRQRFELLKPFLCSIQHEGTESQLDFFTPNISLKNICIDIILSDKENLADIVSYTPPNLRQAILRRAAVFCPLSAKEMCSLCIGEDRSGNTGTNGEIILAGPAPDFGPDTFDALFGFANQKSSSLKSDIDWEDDLDLESPNITSLALISIALPIQSITVLPSTLTHLALIDILPHPTSLTVTPIWRLTKQLPLLEFIDLGNNYWLFPARAFDKISWELWRRLRYVGLKNCGIADDEKVRENARLKIISSIKRALPCVVSFE